MKNRAFYIPALCLMAAMAVPTMASDWNQWRGPNRNGVSTDGVALSKIWPKGELPKLWESEAKIPSEMGFGFSSPVIWGGNVFLFVAWKQSEPLLSPKLSERGLRDEERDNWIKQWLAENLAPDLSEEQKAAYTGIIAPRLKRGKGAIDLAVLEKLATLKERTFATQEDLDKWFADNALSAEVKKAVLDQIPTTVDTTNDTVLCLSGADGKTLWKTVLKKEPPTPLPFKSWGVSATPCVVDGKVYANGLDGVYCLDAKTGKEIWRNAVGGGSSSPCVVGGAVVVQSTANLKQLRALSTKDGKEIWTQPKAGCENSSPVAWQEGQDTYLLCNDGQNLNCVALKDGSVLWSVTGSGPSTPAIGGGYVVVEGNKPAVGLIAYKLGKEKPETAWSLPITNSGSSPVIYKDHVYAEGKDRTLCVELATGKIAWEQKLGVDTYASPSIVDGLMFMTSPQAMTVLNADPADGKVLGKMKLQHLRCTSAAIADGKMVLRSKERITCYDLVNIPAAPEQK